LERPQEEALTFDEFSFQREGQEYLAFGLLIELRELRAGI